MALGHGSGLFSQTEDTLSTSGTDILALVGGRIKGASYAKSLIPVSSFVRSLRVELETAPGAGKSRSFRLWKDGSSTSLTCTISDTDTTGSDLVHQALGSTSSYYEWRCTTSGTPAASRVRISALLDTRNAADDFSYVMSGLDGSTAIGNSTAFLSLAGDYQIADTTDVGSRCYLPHTGKIIAMSARLNTATPPKGDPNPHRRRLQLFKNTTDLGAGYRINYTESDAAGTILITSPGTTTYADGDYLTVKSTATVGTPRDSFISVAVLLASDADEFVVPYTGIQGNLPVGSTTVFGHFAKGVAAPITSFSQRRSCGMAWRGKKMLTNISVLPGGKGQSWRMDSPYGFNVTYTGSSANTLTDDTGGLIKGVFDDLSWAIEATSIGASLKSKFNFALLLEPLPNTIGGTMGVHF